MKTTILVALILFGLQAHAAVDGWKLNRACLRAVDKNDLLPENIQLVALNTGGLAAVSSRADSGLNVWNLSKGAEHEGNYPSTSLRSDGTCGSMSHQSSNGVDYVISGLSKLMQDPSAKSKAAAQEIILACNMAPAFQAAFTTLLLDAAAKNSAPKGVDVKR